MRSQPSPPAQIVIGFALLAAFRYGRPVIAFLVEMIDEANQQGRTLMPGGKTQSDDAYRAGFVMVVRGVLLLGGIILIVGGAIGLFKIG